MTYTQLLEYCNKVDFKIVKEYYKNNIAYQINNNKIDIDSLIINELHPNCKNTHYYDLFSYIAKLIFEGTSKYPNILGYIGDQANYIFDCLYPDIQIPDEQDKISGMSMTLDKSKGLKVIISHTPMYLLLSNIEYAILNIDYKIEEKYFDSNEKTIDYICYSLEQFIPEIIKKLTSCIRLCYYDGTSYSMETTSLIEAQKNKIKYTQLNTILFMYDYASYHIYSRPNDYISKNEFIDFVYKNSK